ncbi:MAG: VTT domain-containing protein [Patescibacteria group bacterium]
MGLQFKSVKLFLGVFIFFLTTYFFFDLIFNISSLSELYIKSLPATVGTASIIILLLVADILLPIPASIVMIASGMLFGGLLGGLIALIGTLSGSIINFQMSRKLGRDRVKKWMRDREYNNLSMVMRKYGAYIVILTRMIPLFMESVSSIAGISNTKLQKFIVMNVVGFVPITFLYSYAGALYKAQPQSIFIILVVGFFVPFIFWYILLKMAGIRHNE